MAADSQGTEGSGNPFTQVRKEVPKIFRLTSRAVWGGAGSGQVIQDLNKEVATLESALEASPDMRTSMMSIVKPTLSRHYNDYLQPPRGVQSSAPVSTFLSCGIDPKGEPWILEIEYNCQATHYEELGFHAIGSGAPFAQLANALLSHFEVRDRPLEHGKLVAHRVMDIAINTSAYGIGGPIQMWTVDSAGVHQLSSDELAAVRTGVGLWQSLEAETLNQVFLPHGEEELTEDLPEPSPDGEESESDPQ